MKRNYQLRYDHCKYFGAGYTQHRSITLTWNSGQSRFHSNITLEEAMVLKQMGSRGRLL